MICLIQRVTNASVSTAGSPHASIGPGLLVFLGIAKTDTEKDADLLARKLSTLRIMDDGEGKMNLSILDTKGEIMVVSQFTLMANLKGGRRPDFFPAKEPTEAKRLYELFALRLKDYNIPIHTGVFGALMQVESVNDGPVTFILNSADLVSP